MQHQMYCVRMLVMQYIQHCGKLGLGDSESSLTHFKLVYVDGSALEERSSRVICLQHSSLIVVGMVTTK